MFASFRNSAIGAAALGLCAGLAVPAQAAYVVTLEQVGANVVATGSGSLDTVALTPPPVGSIQGLFGISLFPSTGSIELTNVGGEVSIFSGISGPGSFGSVTGHFIFASSATNGVSVGIWGGGLVVPVGYVSGTPLGTSILTFDNTTLAALGVIGGTYEWTWGTGGADADSFTLEIGTVTSAVPEPMSAALLGVGLLGITAARRRNDCSDNKKGLVT